MNKPTISKAAFHALAKTVFEMERAQLDSVTKVRIDDEMTFGSPVYNGFRVVTTDVAMGREIRMLVDFECVDHPAFGKDERKVVGKPRVQVTMPSVYLRPDDAAKFGTTIAVMGIIGAKIEEALDGIFVEV